MEATSPDKTEQEALTVKELQERSWPEMSPLLENYSNETLNQLSIELVKNDRLEDALATIELLASRFDEPPEWVLDRKCNLLTRLDQVISLLAFTEKNLVKSPNSNVLKYWYGQSKLKLGTTTGVEALAQNIIKNTPEDWRGWQLLGQLRMATDDLDAAIMAQRRIIALDQNNKAAKFTLIRMLIKNRTLTEARNLLTLYRPTLEAEAAFASLSAELEKALANNYQANGTAAYDSKVEHYKSLRKFFVERNNISQVEQQARKTAETEPDKLQNWLRLSSALLENGKISETRDLCNELFRRFPEQHAEVTVGLAQIETHAGNFKLARALLEAEWQSNTDGAIKIMFPLYSLYKSLGLLEMAYAALTRIERSSIPKYALTMHDYYTIEAENALGRKHNAIALTSKFREQIGDEKFENDYAKLASWYHMQLGNIKEARRIYDGQLHENAFRGQLPATPPTELKTAKTENLARRQLVLITVLKDEIRRIKAFLRHYRRLGVEVFYIVDNDSSDGTTEYLRQQPDVRLFHSNESFAQSGFGLWWARYLISQYLEDRWCIMVDVDEFLVFPHSEYISLQLLCNYMEKNGHEILQTFMLDLFPERLTDSKDWSGETVPQQACPYFDNDYLFTPQFMAPYLDVRGGFRRRLMGDGHGAGPLLVKVALFKGGSGVDFYEAAHHTSPAILSDVTGVLLHCKFVGEFQKYVESHVDSKEHVFASLEYRHYLSWCNNHDPNKSLLCDKSLTYEDTTQLLKLGLLRTSVAFERFIGPKINMASVLQPKILILTHPGAMIEQLLQYLSGLGFQHSAYSDQPITTSVGLAPDYITKDLISGLAVVNHLEQLFNLLTNSYYIHVTTDPQQAISDLKSYSLNRFGSCDLDELRDSLNLAKPEELEFLGFIQKHGSWKEVYAGFSGRVEQFQAQNPTKRIMTVSNPPDYRQVAKFCDYLRMLQDREVLY